VTKTTYVLRDSQLVDKASLQPKPLEFLARAGLPDDYARFVAYVELQIEAGCRAPRPGHAPAGADPSGAGPAGRGRSVAQLDWPRSAGKRNGGR
jgi:hypothetical protein